jgi:hypothetical protein
MALSWGRLAFNRRRLAGGFTVEQSLRGRRRSQGLDEKRFLKYGEFLFN